MLTGDPACFLSQEEGKGILVDDKGILLHYSHQLMVMRVFVLNSRDILLSYCPFLYWPNIGSEVSNA